MAKVARIEHARQVAAPPEVVWELLADHRRMSQWTPVRRAELEREGEPAPNGVGAIRVLYAVGPPLREEITRFQPPRRLDYTMLSGAPVRDYRAKTVLTPVGSGTEVVWSVSLVPVVPGAGLVVRLVIGWLIRGLARESERRAAA